MRVFVLMAHKASTAPFSLDDLPGAAGRMDLVARFISSSLFVSHGIRRDVEVYVVLGGPPSPPKTIKFISNEVRRVSPDERNIASHIRNALHKELTNSWTKSSDGIYVARKSLEEVLIELKYRNIKIFLLDERGRDVTHGITEGAFLMSDHINFSVDEFSVIEKYANETISLGKISMHADHCVVIINYLLDILLEGKTISPPSR